MPDAKPETKTEPAAPKKSSAKLIALVAAGLVLAAGSAGGAWYVTGKDRASGAEKKDAVKKPLFITLEPFTVNLRDPRGERFAQIGVTLQFDDPEVEITVKDRLPAVRNSILLLISAKQIDDLLSPEGKQYLAQEIRAESARAIGVDVPAFVAPVAVAASGAVPVAAPVVVAPAAAAPKAPAVRNPIQAVLFSQFIVQ